MSDSVCRKCGRADCPLLATILVGDETFVQAVINCLQAQKAQEPAHASERLSPHSRRRAAGGGR